MPAEINAISGKKKALIRKSLRASFYDGFFAAVQFGIVEQFVIPFALFLGAGNFAIGLLSFIRNTFVAVIQIFSADVTSFYKSRKSVLSFCVFTAAFLWLPAVFLPLLFRQYSLIIFILLFGIASSFNLFATPSWASLMSQYIPRNKRGRYFGWRGMVLGIVHSTSIVIGGLLLQFFHSFNLLFGFVLLFMIASFTRFLSWYFITQMHEPAWKSKITDYFSFPDFISRFSTSNFARFSVFTSFLLLGVSFASPFISVYLLKELKVSYLTFTFIMGAAVFSTFFFQNYWGYFSDKYGNMKIIKLTSVMIGIIPFLWLFTRTNIYLFFIQLFAGFIWAGFNLSSSNFIYDVAVSGKRERCISYFNFLSGVGLGIGALLGGFFYTHSPNIFGSQYLFLFLVSGVLRLFSAGLIVSFTKEVRTAENIRTRMLLLDISGIRSIGLVGKELLEKTRKKL